MINWWKRKKEKGVLNYSGTLCLGISVSVFWRSCNFPVSLHSSIPGINPAKSSQTLRGTVHYHHPLYHLEIEARGGESWYLPIMNGYSCQYAPLVPREALPAMLLPNRIIGSAFGLEVFRHRLLGSTRLIWMPGQATVCTYLSRYDWIFQEDLYFDTHTLSLDSSQLHYCLIWYKP